MTRKHYGWRPDVPDFRDHKYAKAHFVKEKLPKLPTSVDLRSTGFFPPVYDQGDFSNCTAQATAAAVEFERKKIGRKTYPPSRMFIYWNERDLEGDTASDNGAMLRDAMKAITGKGYCDEGIWPHDKDHLFAKPTDECYKQGESNKDFSYQRLNNTKITELRQCLAAGYPFVFGIQVYDSFSVADDNGGFVPMPGWRDSVEGGHALLCVGYNDKKKHFIVRNSWSDKYGDKGYYYLPYNYLTNLDLADDFWTLRPPE